MTAALSIVIVSYCNYAVTGQARIVVISYSYYTHAGCIIFL